MPTSSLLMILSVSLPSIQPGSISCQLTFLQIVTPLIPIIKKHRPDSKLIFRSHIQSQSTPCRSGRRFS